MEAETPFTNHYETITSSCTTSRKDMHR